MVLINAVTLSQGYNIYLKNRISFFFNFINFLTTKKNFDDDWTDWAIVNNSIPVDILNLVLHFFESPDDRIVLLITINYKMFAYILKELLVVSSALRKFWKLARLCLTHIHKNILHNFHICDITMMLMCTFWKKFCLKTHKLVNF